MKGHTNIKVTKRTIRHLDPHNLQHKLDRAKARAAQAREKLEKEARALGIVPDPLKYACLEGGFCCAPDGRIISGEEHQKTLDAILEKRSWYLGETLSHGKYGTRKRETEPLHNIAVLFRPHHSMGLAALDKVPKNRPILKRLMVSFVRRLAQEFAAKTNLEVVSLEIHPEENELHIHISYASVSAEHHLLWPRGHVGRHGLRLLGPTLISTLWQIKHGLRTEKETKLAEKIFAERCRQADGEPIDWHLTDYLEKLMEFTIEHNGLRSVFERALERYLADVPMRIAERADKAQLIKDNAEAKKRAARAEEQNALGIREAEAAKKKSMEAEAKNASLQAQLGIMKKNFLKLAEIANIHVTDLSKEKRTLESQVARKPEQQESTPKPVEAEKPSPPSSWAPGMG